MITSFQVLCFQSWSYWRAAARVGAAAAESASAQGFEGEGSRHDCGHAPPDATIMTDASVAGSIPILAGRPTSQIPCSWQKAQHGSNRTLNPKP